MKTWLLLLAAAAACSPPGAPPSAAPSFETDIAPVLEARCASAAGCHGRDPTPEVDLVLLPPRAYQHLVGVPAEGSAVPLLRVAPGDPDRSFLVDKLTGSLAPGEGRQMPLSPDTRAPAHPVPRRWLDEVLVRWIEDGAPR